MILTTAPPCRQRKSSVDTLQAIGSGSSHLVRAAPACNRVVSSLLPRLICLLMAPLPAAVAAHTSPCYLGLNSMTEYTLKPAYL